jgi:transposase
MGWTAPDGIISAKLVVLIRNQQRGPSMAKISMIGLDLAKNVFQIHGIDAAGTVVLRRGQMEKFFAQLPPTIVGMEACGGAHHWARVFQKLGHEVRIMPPAYVKPYVKRNKNDGRDAEGVCEAMARPTMRFVPVKSLARDYIASHEVLQAKQVRARLV